MAVPRLQLDRWLAAQADAPGSALRLDPPAILAGSHDALLDWAVRQSGCGLALRGGGSLDGLFALAEGAAMAAASHVLDPDAGTFNEAAARDALPHRPIVGIVWAWRSQGLILARGNPWRSATSRISRGRASASRAASRVRAATCC